MWNSVCHILPTPSRCFFEVIGSPWICWDPSCRCLEVDPEVAWGAGGAFGGRTYGDLRGNYTDLIWLNGAIMGISWGYDDLDVSETGHRHRPSQWPLSWGNCYEPIWKRTFLGTLFLSENIFWRFLPATADVVPQFGMKPQNIWDSMAKCPENCIVPPKCHVSGKVAVLLCKQTKDMSSIQEVYLFQMVLPKWTDQHWDMNGWRWGDVGPKCRSARAFNAIA